MKHIKVTSKCFWMYFLQFYIRHRSLNDMKKIQSSFHKVIFCHVLSDILLTETEHLNLELIKNYFKPKLKLFKNHKINSFSVEMVNVADNSHM